MSDLTPLDRDSYAAFARCDHTERIPDSPLLSMCCVRAALAAARPLIEAEVREQIATELAEPDGDVLTEMHVAIEDELIELRDLRMSELCANGLVVREADGSPSSVIRIGTRWAVARVLRLAGDRIARGGERRG